MGRVSTTQIRDTVPAVSPLAPRAGKKWEECGGGQRHRLSSITHGRGTSCDHNLHVVSYLAKVDLSCSTPAASTTSRCARSAVGAVVRRVGFGLRPRLNRLDSRRLHIPRSRSVYVGGVVRLSAAADSTLHSDVPARLRARHGPAESPTHLAFAHSRKVVALPESTRANGPMPTQQGQGTRLKAHCTSWILSLGS